MPNRILKESICTSENIDQLSPLAEIAFYRLMVNCDDYGRMDGRVKVIKSRLFPLKDIGEDEMLGLLSELEKADLIRGYQVDGKPYLQMKTWERHQQVRAKKSKYPSADDNACDQMISNDIKCPRNPIQSNIESESESEAESECVITDSAAAAIQSDHNRVMDAAEDAGFVMSNSVRSALIRLYAENGLQKVLDGIASCVKHGAPNLAYLEGCMNDKPKPKKKPAVIAQDFEQRDYTDVQKQLEDETAQHVIQMLKDNGEWDYEHNCSKGTWRGA